MGRPSTFAPTVIDYIHAKRGPFMLSEIRRGCAIKDSKTVKSIVERLVTLRYMRYIDSQIMRKRWHITNRWPAAWQGSTLVKEDYLTMRLVERGVKSFRKGKRQ